MNKRRYRALSLTACIVISSAYSSSSSAQTAEETVAFILEGLEDNIVQKTQDGPSLYVSNISHKPGTNIFDVKEETVGGEHNGNVEYYSYTFNVIGKCRFSMIIKNRDKDLEPDSFEIDMAKYNDYYPLAGVVHYRFKGACPVKYKKECMDTYTSPYDRKDYTRLDAATAYLRSKICAQGAF